jgi:hypothetical protein
MEKSFIQAGLEGCAKTLAIRDGSWFEVLNDAKYACALGAAMYAVGLVGNEEDSRYEYELVVSYWPELRYIVEDSDLPFIKQLFMAAGLTRVQAKICIDRMKQDFLTMDTGAARSMLDHRDYRSVANAITTLNDETNVPRETLILAFSAFCTAKAYTEKSEKEQMDTALSIIAAGACPAPKNQKAGVA